MFALLYTGNKKEQNNVVYQEVDANQALHYPLSNPSLPSVSLKKTTNKDEKLKLGSRVRCLVVGTNYIGTTRLQLDGGISDVKMVEHFWKTRMGFNTSNRASWCLCTDDSYTPWTSEVQFDAIAWLSDDLRPCDIRFFHFSGHGVALPSSEQDSRLEYCMLPIDSEQPNRQTLSNKDLYEKYLKRFIGTDAYSFLVFDCCHSGNQLYLIHCYEYDTEQQQVHYRYQQHLREKEAEQAQVNIVCFASTRRDERASEVVANIKDFFRPIGDANVPNQQTIHGAFTSALYDCVDSTVDKRTHRPTITYRQLLTQVTMELTKSGVNQQHPQLSSSRPLNLDSPIFDFDFKDAKSDHEVNFPTSSHFRGCHLVSPIQQQQQQQER